MNDNYIAYVHNLIGKPRFKRFNSKVREAIFSSLKHNFYNYNELEKSILQESSVEVYSYISEHLDLKKYFKNIVFTTYSKSYTDNVDFSNVRAIVNFKRINHIRYINEHFRSVNKLLPNAGIYIGRVETYWERKLKIYRKFGQQLGRLIWISDFILNRVFPRLRILNRVYSLFTRGEYHTMSSAEILGRLIYCGFDIIEYKIINGLFYFVVMKTKEPSYDKSPSFHPIIKLMRIGKYKKLIGVYKLRTMHPYSEYLQDFVIKLNGYNEVGKPAFDFRVTRWGKWMRKFWIDEFPQIINVLKGEMKLVGIRPLSQVRFNQLPEKLQNERVNYKPGCFPPYVALGMPDSEGNIEAEWIYLNDKAKDPYFTDIKYFFMSLNNILFKKLRSS